MWKVIFSLILAPSSNEGFFDIPRYSSSLTEALTDIVSNFYLVESTTISIAYSSEHEGSSIVIQEMIDEVLCTLPDIVVHLENYSNIKRYAWKRRFNIFFCDNFESFQKIFSKMTQLTFDYQGFYLIVFNGYDNPEDILKIFQSLWSLQIINANLLLMEEKGSTMYTYFPYTSGSCGVVMPVKINQFRNGKWLVEAKYFPQKIYNLFKCPMSVATFSNPPFAIIHEVKGNFELDGIDGILLRVLSQRLNFTVELHVDNKLLWGEVNESGLASGGCIESY